MEIRNKTVIVTGGGTGIGRALVLAFAQGGRARARAVADIDHAGAAQVAAEAAAAAPDCQIFAQRVDVADAAAVQGSSIRPRSALVRSTSSARTPASSCFFFFFFFFFFFCKGLDATDAEWLRIWEINVMAHIHAAKAVLPQMLERGEGYFVNTVSAAGLLSQIGSAPYAVTKHAAIGFAEWLSITYGERGIRVSCICPQGVQTKMLFGEGGERKGFLQAGFGHAGACCREDARRRGQ